MDRDGVSVGHTDSPTCFLHIPKCGGSSVRVALEQALPPGSLAPQGYVADGEPADFAQLPPEQRSEFVVGMEEMRSVGRRYRAILGHFSLDTMLTVADPASIGTVLREPRARLLSVYMYARVPGVAPDWAYNPTLHDPRPLNEFLAEPFRAPQIDNVICRMLLDGDSRLPPQGFVSPSEVPGLAADAIERLESLGFVGALELGDSVWPGISKLFGLTLRPAVVRVTGEPAFMPHPMGRGQVVFDQESLDLVEQRCAGDTVVYDHVLAQAGCDEGERRRVEAAAFAVELVKLGGLVSGMARPEPDRDVGEFSDRSAEFQRLSDELQREHDELETTRRWLDSVQTSASWRLTAPLRAVKHRMPTAADKRAE